MHIQKFIIAEKSEANDQEQSIVGWGSKPVPDRDGELIESTAWKLEQYRKNPVLMLSHDYSSPPVGKCLWIKSDSNGLKFKAKFANTERGKEIYQLYKDGIMSGFSVGFSINKATDNPSDGQYKSMNLKRVYHDVELLEISCVAIPACPDALIEQVKTGKIMNKQLKDELDHVIEIVESKKEVVTKPEVTENYVRVPVSDGHTDCNIKTIDISASEGIKALYCVDDKVIMTYLFDKEKWTMEEARKWIDAHKKEGTIFFATFEDGGDIVHKDGILLDGKPVEEKPSPVTQLDVDAICSTLQKLSKEIEDLKKKQEDEEGEDESCTCPGGGSCGKDYGKFPECEGCKYAAKCKSESEEESSEEESSEEEKACGGGGKKPKKKDMPSVYDLFMVLNRAVLAEKSIDDAASPYVIDVYPTDFPNGYVIYATEEGYVKSDYSVDLETGVVTMTGKEIIEKEWVHKRYPAETQTIEDTVEKEDDTVVTLVGDEPIIELVEKSVETKDGTIDIDPDMVREVLKSAFDSMQKEMTKDIVGDALKRIKGRVS